MQISIRAYAAALVLTAILTLTATRAVEGANTNADADTETPSIAEVTYFNGSTWIAVKTTTGTYEGPAGGASPTARMKANLGGPKTYFMIAGTTSELVITAPRPRFRFHAESAVAARAQLAQFEAHEATRRTTIEIGKVALFTKGADLEVTKVSEGLYEVRPKKSLQPGQYALVTSENGAVADFAIVESGY